DEAGTAAGGGAGAIAAGGVGAGGGLIGLAGSGARPSRRQTSAATSTPAAPAPATTIGRRGQRPLRDVGGPVVRGGGTPAGPRERVGGSGGAGNSSGSSRRVCGVAAGLATGSVDAGSMSVGGRRPRMAAMRMAAPAQWAGANGVSAAAKRPRSGKRSSGSL